MKYRLDEIAKIVGGIVIGENNLVDNVVFDSRNTNRNQNSLFLAIESVNRNGHNYIADMVGCGVPSYLVSDKYLINAKTIIQDESQVGFVVVKDTMKAIQELAEEYRRTLSMPFVAICGSNGKTITKEWIVQMMPNDNIFRSPKSYNSQLGVPISILMINGDERMAIIEAGISKPCEMIILEKIIKPQVVVFTNINTQHQENFVDVFQKLSEKMILAKNCKFIVYNSDDEKVDKFINENLKSVKKISWGESPANIIKSVYSKSKIEIEYQLNSYKTDTPFDDFGSYQNIMNALGFVVSIGADLSVALGVVPNLESIEMRLQLMNGINNCRIINDSYSNDINSLAIALNYMNSIAPDQKHILIISDFIQSDQSIHIKANELLKQYDIEIIYSIGSKIKDALKDVVCNHVNYSSTEEFCKYIDKRKFNNSTVLIKGSRVFSFEKITSLLQEKTHSTILQIDLEALTNNYKIIKSKLSRNVKTVGMVKALAYGSGTYEIASSLCDAGIDYLAVAYIDEGIVLRESGITKPIIILNSSINDFELIITYRLQPEMYSSYILDVFDKYCKSNNILSYPIHIKLDTGMNRLGFKQSEVGELCEKVRNSETIKIESIFSHLSSADDKELDDVTNMQIKRFDEISSQIINDLNIPNVMRHICNSAGVERFPNAHFDMVRLGLAMYGISDYKGIKNISSLKSSIIQIKDVREGEAIGYNQKSIADRDIRIAIVSIGYADGLNRMLSSGRWSMKVAGELAPTIGNISMDNCAIDITGINAQEGDEVIVFDCKEDIIKMADLLGTIPYEILTSVSSRIKREYYK